MADQKVSAMTNASALAGGEEFHVVQSTNDRAASIDQVKTYVTTTPLAVVGNATAGAELRLPEDTDNGTNYVGLKAPDTIASNITYTLPGTVTNGYYLQTDGSGNLSWAAVSGASLATPLAVVGNATAGAEIRLPEDTDNGSNYVAIKAPDSLSATYTLTLPSDDGSADQYLKTDGSGGLSWATVSGASAPLTLASGTITDPSVALTVTQTWNDAADTFEAVVVSVTNTASDAASELLDMRVGGSSVMTVRRDGFIAVGSNNPTSNAGIGHHTSGDMFLTLYGGGSGSDPKVLIGGGSFPYALLGANGALGWSSNNNPTNSVADTTLFRSAAGIISVRGSGTSTGGALNFLEQTAPSAPSANQVVIYAEDNGSGKTRLMARFNTGAAQQIAIEP